MTLSTRDVINIEFPNSDLPDLARAIDPDNIPKLIAVFGGLEIRFPTRDEFMDACRNFCVWLAWRRGVPNPRMADQFKITRQRVWQICRGVEKKVRAYEAALVAGTLTRDVFEDPDKDVASVLAWMAGKLPNEAVGLGGPLLEAPEELPDEGAEESGDSAEP